MERLEERRVLAGTPVTLTSVGGTDSTVTADPNDRDVVGFGEANGSVTVWFNTTQLGIAPVDANRNFTYRLTNSNLITIGQGANKSITAKQTDSGGTPTQSAFSFAVDTVVPAVSISSNKTTLGIGGTATLTITLSEDPVNFTATEVSSTNGVLSDFQKTASRVYTATFTPALNFEGPGTVQVAAGKITDGAGNPNPASNQVTIAIDTLAPAAPTAPVLLALDDSGTPGDLVTNVTRPRFQGTAAATLPVTLVATAPDGTTSEMGTVNADANGKWTIKSDALTNGLWTIQARTVDPAGNRSVLSPETKLTISKVTPASPTVSLASTSDTGLSNSDGVTSITTPTFLGTAPAGLTVTVYRTNLTASDPPEAIGSVVVDANGQWILPFDKATVPFTEAVYNITAKAVDTAGNASAVGALPTGLTVDTTAPTITTLTAATAAPNQAVASVAAVFNDGIYGLKAEDFLLTLKSGSSFRTITLAGTASVTMMSPGAPTDTSWTIGNLATMTGGTGDYTFTLNQARIEGGKTAAADLAGNPLTFTSTSATWSTDTTAPRVKSMTLQPTPATTRNTAVTAVAIVFDEVVTGVSKAAFKLTRTVGGTTTDMPLTAATLSPVGSATSSTWTLANIAGLQGTDGQYTLRLVAASSGIKDTAQNGMFGDAATTWTLDKTAPTASFSAVGSAVATPLDSILLTFSEPVKGVQLADFSLACGSTVVPFTAATTLSPSSDPATTYVTTYVLSGLPAYVDPGTGKPDGTYTLSFNKDSSIKVEDTAGNQMSANPASATWRVDTSVPTATIGSPTPATRNTAVTTVAVRFDKPVSGLDLADFQLTRNGSLVPLTGAVVSGSNAAYSLAIPTATTTPDGDYSLRIIAVGSGIKAIPAPQNALQSDSLPASWTMDATKPTVALTLVGKTGSKFTVRALFSEKVTGFTATDTTNDVTIAGGTISNPRDGALVGQEYLFDVTPNAGDPVPPVTITIKADAAQDDAGNTNTVSGSLTLKSDFTPPTVTLAAAAATNQNFFTVTATFSESVTVLKAAGVNVTNGSVHSITGSGTVWTITVKPTAAGLVTVKLNAGAANDASGNPSVASNVVGVTYDTVTPKVTLSTPTGSATNLEALSVVATFDEPVTGVTASTLSIVTGNAKVTGFAGSGDVYTFQVQPTADGAITFRVNAGACADAAGNKNPVSNSLVVTSDRTAPNVVSISTPSATGDVTITFSEEVVGFDTGDLQITRDGGSISLAGVVLAGPTGGTKTIWTLPLGSRVAGSGVYRLQIAATGSGITDRAGNALPDDSTSSASTLVKTFTVDTTPPTVVLAAASGLTNKSPFTVTATFSESVTGLTAAGVNVTNGSVSSITGSGTTWTIAVRPTAAGLVNVTLKSGAANDASGNASVISNVVGVTYDNVRPTAAFVSPPPATTTTPITAIILEFSELVTGLDVADFSLQRDGTAVALKGASLQPTAAAKPSYLLGNLAPLTSVPGSYTLTLRSSGTGIVDPAGNLLANQPTVAWKHVGPTLPGSVSGTFTAVSPNPRTTAVPSVALSFTAAVTGIGPEDFALSRTVSGITTPLSTAGLTVTATGAAWSVGNLASVTALPGDYELRLKAAGSGIASTGGQSLASDVVTTWTTVATLAAPTASLSLDTAPSSGAAFDSVTITFSKPVTGVTLAAFTLLRNGVSASLTGTTLVAVSSSTYRISGLAPIVAAAANYELQLVAAGSGITGTDGSVLATTANVVWTQAVTTVRAAFLGGFGSTASPVAAVKLRFSEAVRGVDVSDFDLSITDSRGTRNITPLGMVISGSGTSWTIGSLAGLQSGPGLYTLKLKKVNGDIKTAGGATLAEDASVQWTLT